MKLNQFVQGQIYGVSSRLQGLAMLFQNNKSDGPADRDDEAMIGIGELLQDIADQSRRLCNLADEADLFPELTVNPNWAKPDPIGQIEKQVKEFRKSLDSVSLSAGANVSH